ncbi:CheB methylesterase domain-containing protein [Yoonia sp. GPGPB17]|uniref:CheB methylesterase domain-containing protein n=1 Tax=Yoonia sp. GPGPB17 TaxID=3026147 RepID=UPI0030BC91DA
MKYLIAHQSLLRLARIKYQVMALISDVDIIESSTLTDAYNLAEHAEPSCVVISQELAEQAEFELLASLFGIMNIICIVLTTGKQTPRAHPLFPGIRMVPELDLEDAIRRTARLSQPAQNQTHPAGKSPTVAENYDHNRLILLGASTGGIDALLMVTQCFDHRCPPVLIVQHTGGSFAASLIRLLNAASPANVIAAADNMALSPGHMYLAPDDQAHLVVAAGRQRHLALRKNAPISGHRPSVDALFNSAIPQAPKVSAALLTGMGKDGAAGLTKLRHAGAHTIGQDRQTSVVYGMPRVAMEMGGVGAQLPIQEIGPALLKSCKVKQRV